MKIGILTFHFAHNYGAMLQAFALSTKLRMMGYDAELIDYRLPYIYRMHEKYDFRGLVKARRETSSNLLIAFLKAAKGYRRNLNKDAKWYRFEDFLNNVLPKSHRIYDYSLINSMGYDAIVCGSDQIWNNTLTGDLVPEYFGYGLNVKVITYAASNGHDAIPEAVYNKFMQYISHIQAIGIREVGLSYNLNEQGVKNTQVLDPIFLLGKETWSNVAFEPDMSDYVLTYSFAESPHFFEIARNIAKRLNKKLVCFLFCPQPSLSDDVIQVITGGPQEFLGFFKNASYVVTNSFHGTAFALLFQKQFTCVPPLKRRERLDSVLSLYNLQGQIVDDDAAEYPLSAIDYTQLNCTHQQLKSKSETFLRDNL